MSTLNVTTIQDSAAAFEHARLVQVVNTQTGTLATDTTAVPDDDTIPQNDEGLQVMTLAITPTHASNKLKIDVVVYGGSAGTGDTITACLFQDSTVGSLASAQHVTQGSSTSSFPVVFTHFMAAGTTSSTTFKVRAGLTAGTFSFNGANGTRGLGGVMASSITISEIRRDA